MSEREEIIVGKSIECCLSVLYTFLTIRHNSTDSVPLSNLVCIKTAPILNYQSRDLKHGDTFCNNCEVLILSMESIGRLNNQGKSLVQKCS